MQIRYFDQLEEPSLSDVKCFNNTKFHFSKLQIKIGKTSQSVEQGRPLIYLASIWKLKTMQLLAIFVFIALWHSLSYARGSHWNDYVSICAPLYVQYG